MRGCEGLGQLVGLRALYITQCGRLRDAAALSSLVDLRTLQLTSCRQLRAGSLAPSLAAMTQLTSLNFRRNAIGAVGAHSHVSDQIIGEVERRQLCHRCKARRQRRRSRCQYTIAP